MEILLIKVMATSLLMLSTTFIAQRWGDRMAGWVLAVPITSGPIAFFLFFEQGAQFAKVATSGMLLATVSQILFCVLFFSLLARGWRLGFLLGAAVFVLMTWLLRDLRPNALIALLLAIGMWAVGVYVVRKRPAIDTDSASMRSAKYVALKVLMSNVIVLALTEAAHLLGPNLIGLISPFPILGATLVIITRYEMGVAAARDSLAGFVAGLIVPVIFFCTVTISIVTLGIWSFIVAALISVALPYFGFRKAKFA